MVALTDTHRRRRRTVRSRSSLANMRMSFSLTSLQPCGNGLERVEQTRTRVDRSYNSLNKKRKEPMQEHSIKYGSGPEDSKDDFWAAIRTNYDYIMDTNLIDTCKEANGELTWDESDISIISWGLKEVSCQFSELYSWLQILQELVYSKEENLLDKSLRVAHTEELRRKAYRRRLFNDQAEKLIARSPSLKDEVSWRIDHLNAKWDLLEQIMAPVQRSDELDNQDVSADFEHEVKCLRKWLHEMEARLQPLNFRVDWSRVEIEEKAVEHMVLQRDIESHGRIVCSVVKLGERVARQKHCLDRQLKQDQDQYYRRQQALRIANSLERRWHLLFLRALEWQCHIEALAARVRTKLTASHCSSDSDDEEPVIKQPRLNHRFSPNKSAGSFISQDENNCNLRKRRVSLRMRRQLRTRPESRSLCIISDSHSNIKYSSPVKIIESSYRSELFDVPSGITYHDEESYFEDNIDKVCIMNVKNEKIPNDTKLYSSKRHLLIRFSDQGTEADIEEGELTEEEVDISLENSKSQSIMTLISDLMPPTTVDETYIRIGKLEPNNTSANDNIKRRKMNVDESALFNTSNRKSKNCATFYFKHMDTDSEIDSHVNNDTILDDYNQFHRGLQHSVVADESSEEEWTYTSARIDTKPQQLKPKNVGVKLCLDFNALTVTATTMMSDNKKDNNVHSNTIEIPNDCTETELQHNQEQDRIDINNSDDDRINTKDCIEKLIREVEKLVREEGKVAGTVPSLIFDEDKDFLRPQNHRAKYTRIKEWLALNSALCNKNKNASQYCMLTASETLDSCDASGEYTSGESDAEKQSETSEEEIQSSVVTCRTFDDIDLLVSQASSTEILKDDEEELLSERNSISRRNFPLDACTPKVVLRSKRKCSYDSRPWSVSCITQIRKRASFEAEDNNPISQFSISETALHQLVRTSYTKSALLDSAEPRVVFNNITSALLDETTLGHNIHIGKNSSLRRKKNRLRKKNLGRKNDSGSDSININNQRSDINDEMSLCNNVASRSNRKPINGRQIRSSRATSTTMTSTTMTTTTTIQTLVKSGSFSGCNTQRESCERTLNNDPQPNYDKQSHSCSTSSSSTESRKFVKNLLDCGNSACAELIYSNYGDNTIINKQMHVAQYNAGDSDTEKNSLGNNSFSEQAWDNYQEKYMSEPYSEAVDIETATRLLEFGDDYRNFLDSQSDCASSLSAVHYKGNTTSEDSDSDSELKRLTETSRSQLLLSEAQYGTMTDNSFSELRRLCGENIRCLRAILSACSASRHSNKNYKQIRGLIERWESLSLRIEDVQKINAIHYEMATMKLEFCTAIERLTSHQVVLDKPYIVENGINSIQNELAFLRDRKTAMLTLNISIHRLIMDLGQRMLPVSIALKDGVADLYRLWDEAFQKGNQQLCALQGVLQFGIRLTELQFALRRDKDTLAILDAALNSGATMEVASSIRDVARLLSEKHEETNQVISAMTQILEERDIITQLPNNETSTTISSLIGFEGGSLSDSGISDSGSEQELSERERQLTALRRLIRSLESLLISDSIDEVLGEFWRHIEEAEITLRMLQNQCRALIVKTATSVESQTNIQSTTPINYIISSKQKNQQHLEVDKPKIFTHTSRVQNLCTSVNHLNNDSGITHEWVWRIFRAGLPFQFALVVLLCATCLLEPQCCEGGNSLNFSLTPQLRYIHGPPPV